MTISRVYGCPGTLRHPPHQFRYLHHPSVEADPLPRYCAQCGYDSEGEDIPEAVTAPHIAKTIGKTVDDMYRGMEEGAEHRAAMAMEQFGLDKDESAQLKITNMRDDIHTGDTSDIPVKNEITKIMAEAPQGTFGFQSRDQGWEYSQAAHQTPIIAERNPGARTMHQLRSAHAAFTSTAGHAGATTSSMPALETTRPDYRRRV
jgi:hypothetical protein